MHSHRTLHALITLLTLALMLIGPAAPTRLAQAETPPPPPPARESYTHWDGPNHVLQPLPKEAAARVQAPAQNIVPQVNCARPSRFDFAVIVFDAVQKGDPFYNDDIYMVRRPCEQVDFKSRVTTDPADDYMPRLSKDTKKIAFVSNRDANAEIYLTGAALNGTQTRLTNNNSTDTMPTFSPDGKKIAFVSNRGGSANIYTMNLDGSGVKRLTNAGVNDLTPDWSPDGKQIAYVRRSADGINGALYMMNADGSNQHAILGYQRWMNRPVWSPSGKKLAFEYDPNGDGWFDLGTVNANGSGLSKLPIPRQPNNIGYPNGYDFQLGSWLPDETGLVYNANLSYYYESQWYIYSSLLYYHEISSRTDTLISGDSYYFYPYIQTPDSTAPHSTLEPLPEYTRLKDLYVKVTATDDNLGLGTINIQSRTEQYPSWTTAAKLYFSGSKSYWSIIDVYLPSEYAGQTIYFRSQAVDYGGNYEADKPAAEAWTRAFNDIFDFRVTDVRDHPLTAQPVTLNPPAMNTLITGTDGKVKAYIANDVNSNPAEATYNRTGYGSPPLQKFRYGYDYSIHTALPGTDEVLVNGHFNDAADPLTGWQTGGTIPVKISPTIMHRAKSAQLGPCIEIDYYCAGGEASLSQTVSVPANMHNPTLSFFYVFYGDSTTPTTFQAIFTPQNDQPVTLLNQPVISSGGPQHAWVDMSPYLGQTGMLTFHLDQSAGYVSSEVFLEEVSLTSWTTPVLTSAGPLAIPFASADGAWIDLDGENFGPTAQVFLGEMEITALERTGSTHIRFQLPVGISPGPYDLHIVNPGGAEARPERPLWVGYFLNLPSISR